MAKKRDYKEDIKLIERLIQDQLDLIGTRLLEIERPPSQEEALKTATQALHELQESCTLVKALVGHLKNNGNGHA
jgi:hypothetical protein